MIKLNAAEVLDNAERAFKEGRLQMQQPDYKGDCAYTGPCAIGVSLTPEQQILLDKPIYSWELSIYSSGISEFIEENIVETDSPNALISLQNLHDEGSLTLEDFQRIRELYL